VANGSPHVERYIIDLDQPPAERWREVALMYKDAIPSVLIEVESQLDDKGVDRKKWLQNHNIPSEYLSELVGFANYVDSPEVTLPRLIIWQLAYELGFSFTSSSILAVDQNGTVIHGRNMDTMLRFIARGKRMDAEDVLIEAVYTRGGEPIFSSLGLVGHVGVTAGMTLTGTERNASWSFQQSTWYASLPTSNLAAAKHGGLPSAFVGRSLLENRSDFKDAVRKAMTLKLMAPTYLILAGSDPWQGAVLVMDRLPSRTKKAVLHRAQVLSRSIDRWFIVQTNDNFWMQGLDDRRPKGVKLMASLGQANTCPETVLLTLRTAPLFNDLTTLSWLGVPRTGQQMSYKAQESLRLIGKSGLRPELLLQRIANRSRDSR